MANIMVTERCNLQCEYCFAREKLGTDEMPLSDFTKALTFCTQGQRNPHIGIIGGEPTLHSDFENILKAAISSNAGSITVFTNGTNLEQYAKLLTHRKVGLLINFNGADMMGQELYDTMGKNILLIYKDYMSGNISLGLNIYKSSVPQLQDLLEVSKLLKLRKLRLSVSVPSAEHLASQGITNYFKTLKQTYIDVCLAFDAIDIAVSQDCNYIPQCVFNQSEIEMLDRLSEKYAHVGVNYINPTVCRPVIDILPGLQTIRCFGMSEQTANIEDFRNLYELSNYFHCKTDQYLAPLHVSLKCDGCEARYRGCNMGCLRAKAGRLAASKAAAAVLNGEIS